MIASAISSRWTNRMDGLISGKSHRFRYINIEVGWFCEPMIDVARVMGPTPFGADLI